MHLEDKELIDELLRQIDICEHQVNAYSNKRDKDSKNMWYYWYGRREACDQILAYIRNRIGKPRSSEAPFCVNKSPIYNVKKPPFLGGFHVSKNSSKRAGLRRLTRSLCFLCFVLEHGSAGCRPFVLGTRGAMSSDHR